MMMPVEKEKKSDDGIGGIGASLLLRPAVYYMVYLQCYMTCG
jgi:hypothetical protein